jgi:hypothetical protein
VLKTKEEFRAAVERYRKQLSPEQEAAERKALAEAKKHFAPPLEQTIAQAKEATEAIGEIARQVADARKWVDHAQRELTSRAASFNNSLVVPRGLFERLSRGLCLPEIAEASTQLNKWFELTELSTRVTQSAGDDDREVLQMTASHAPPSATFLQHENLVTFS